MLCWSCSMTTLNPQLATIWVILTSSKFFHPIPRLSQTKDIHKAHRMFTRLGALGCGQGEGEAKTISMSMYMQYDVLLDRLSDWLTDWLNDWSIDCVTDRFIHCFMCWFMYRLVDWLIGCLPPHQVATHIASADLHAQTCSKPKSGNCEIDDTGVACCHVGQLLRIDSICTDGGPVTRHQRNQMQVLKIWAHMSIHVSMLRPYAFPRQHRILREFFGSGYRLRCACLVNLHRMFL